MDVCTLPSMKISITLDVVILLLELYHKETIKDIPITYVQIFLSVFNYCIVRNKVNIY